MKKIRAFWLLGVIGILLIHPHSHCVFLAAFYSHFERPMEICA